MAHTYTNLLTHALFSTKDRMPSIDAELKPRLLAYMGGIARKLGVPMLSLNGPSDHVHMLLLMPPTLCLADFMEKLKGNSSLWVHRQWPSRKVFAWQVGYTAFSVSQSNAAAVKRYIANQEEHHRKLSFKEEVLQFLRKHGVVYDEHHVFD